MNFNSLVYALDNNEDQGDPQCTLTTADTMHSLPWLLTYVSLLLAFVAGFFCGLLGLLIKSGALATADDSKDDGKGRSGEYSIQTKLGGLSKNLTGVVNQAISYNSGGGGE